MNDFWLVIRAFHLVAMAFFVGGQLMLAAAVVPVLRGDSDNQRMRAIARRFGIGTLAAIGVLLATGVALAGHFSRWQDPLLHTKLTLVAVVGVLIVWHMRKPALRVLDGAIFVLSLSIVWFGLAMAH